MKDQVDSRSGQVVSSNVDTKTVTKTVTKAPSTTLSIIWIPVFGIFKVCGLISWSWITILLSPVWMLLLGVAMFLAGVVLFLLSLILLIIIGGIIDAIT